MEEKKKILEMLEKGIITAEEAEELLDALSSYDDDKEYDEKTLNKIKNKLKKAFEKIEEKEKELSDKLLKSDFEELNNKINEKLDKVEKKLNTIYNKSIKENFKDLGNSFKRFGKKIADAFKNEKEDDKEKPKEDEGKEYIELEVVDDKKSEE